MTRRGRLAPILLATLAAAASAADWPHLRGPAYGGVSAETGIAESWPAGGPPVLWHIELGQGYSALIAVGDRLYTQYQTLSGQYVACLDAATGRRIWRYRYGYPWEPDGNWPGPRATPTWCDGRIYFAGAFGLVGCLDEGGRLLWSVNVTEKFEGHGTEYGYACSPLVEGGRVFLPVGGEGASVVALNAADGSVAWRSGDEQASYSPALPVTVGGGRQVVTFLRNVVAGFEPATGRQLWESRWSESYDEHAAWPVYQEPYLLTCSAFRGGARVLRLRAGAPPSLAWQSKGLSNDIFSSLILGGHIYGFDLHDFQPRETRGGRGVFKCIELETGKVLWSADRTGHANVLAADGKLILLNDLGELILARARPDRYEELCRAQVFRGQVCWTPPTLSRGRLYVRNQSHAACIYLGDPARLAADQARTTVGSIPLAHRGIGILWQGSALYAPRLGEMLRWYGWCVVAIFGASGLIALLARLVVGRAWPSGAATTTRAVFWVGLFSLGAAGTFVLGGWTGEFTFTWPCSVFAGYQALLILAAWARGRGRGARWLSRTALVPFIALCYGYFSLCRSLFVVMGYGFLVGMLPAFPVAVMAGRRLAKRGRLRADLAWAVLSFSAFFWPSAIFIVWKT